MPRSSEETQIQIAVCNYIRDHYPTVLFNADLSGMNLSRVQASQAKMMRSGRGFPDIAIYEPKGQYHGLFIELKTESARVFKANGDPADEHISEQLGTIESLLSRGYMADIAIGFEQAIELIDNYMRLG